MRPLLLATLLACTDAHAATPWQNEAAAQIPPFAEQLLGTVRQAITEGGPIAAVQACQAVAPQIASEHSQHAWQVGRTSLKVRNPDNVPDAWERAVLERFASAAEAGTPVKELRHGEEVDGQYRYMQAIAVGEPCMACHGTAIKAEVQDAIDQYYPQDQARGYQVGELRGAFTLRRPIAQETP
ncbi:DUF3365 domain-containing protein [Ectopseudomonas alcaliphila]|uniref:DUF3365 domain-containing protein n=1 Tax=Ectopseudomonas alcaliphila TaxID=101564 RepID=A0A1G7J2M4_9GAMM|nr:MULTISPECIES: DUF3365 domain-containing protein [Pseudomonas]MDH1866806.1 DUF3365 domain-containing protein [Pseudomonas chengduensis]MDX5995323.1 DUF3365 domain-containing protein [Pseudomonas alcaliphila]SDF19044.1 Protein of unknown function [Pseudomonas alcaliphila]